MGQKGRPFGDQNPHQGPLGNLGTLKGTLMGTVKMGHFWDHFWDHFGIFLGLLTAIFIKSVAKLTKAHTSYKERVIITFSSKYELFEDHFRTFTPDPDQRQGSVQPITKNT